MIFLQPFLCFLSQSTEWKIKLTTFDLSWHLFLFHCAAILETIVENVELSSWCKWEIYFLLEKALKSINLDAEAPKASIQVGIEVKQLWRLSSNKCRDFDGRFKWWMLFSFHSPTKVIKKAARSINCIYFIEFFLNLMFLLIFSTLTAAFKAIRYWWDRIVLRRGTIKCYHCVNCKYTNFMTWVKFSVSINSKD